jgi:NADH-quinone oxidoreductase subunit L
MTFHGGNRSGTEEARHIHEVPAVMWLPLAILAGLSVVGGWLNVPESIAHAPVFGWLPSSEWVHEWLHPVTEAAERIAATNLPAAAEHAPFGGGAVLWAALSVLLAVSVITIAAFVTGRRRYAPAAESVPPRGFARVLYNKWYVDEFYEAVVVRPVLAISRGMARFIDQFLIDGAVNGAGFAARAFGWVGSRLQTGQLNSYAFALVAGVLLLIALVVF